MQQLQLLPAIDIQSGQVIQSKNLSTSGITSSPQQVIEYFVSKGTKWIHLVDLDAAYETGENSDLINNLITKSSLEVQLSGGISNQASLSKALKTKAKWINLSTGALSDLEKVTKQARAMVTIYGLNEKLGNITYYDSSGQNEYQFDKPYSEKTAQLIDEEISAIIEGQYERAKQILRDNRDKLSALAEELLKHEVIFKENLETIFGKRPWLTAEEKVQAALEEKNRETAAAEAPSTGEAEVTPGAGTPSEAPASEGVEKSTEENTTEDQGNA